MIRFQNVSIIVFILCCLIFQGCLTDDSQNNGMRPPKMFYVSLDGSANFSSIQNAIENAYDNDTIIVNAGIYNEHLHIDRSISLIGEKKESTIINGSGSGDVVLISADFVNFSSFTIRNAGDSGFPEYDAALQIDADHILIDNIILFGNSYGIYCYNGSFNTFDNNRISSSGEYGMYVSFCFNNTIKNNVFFENDCSLKIKGSQGCIVLNNLFNDSMKGMYFCCGSKNNLVYNNSFTDHVKWNGDDQVGLNHWSNLDLKRGNFWDDYSGIDADGDGIGDSSYVPENNAFEDMFPLINSSLLDK